MQVSFIGTNFISEYERILSKVQIICVWGRIGGNLGNYKVVSSKDEQDMELIIDTIKKRRKQRGYRLCS
jgi:predicted DNA-binding WGR domain protein